MEIGIERLAALAFIVTGLSHVAAPRAWARFFIDMRARGAVGGLVNAYVHIPLGLLIVALHWVWTWPGMLTTAIGCALTLKGTLYFLWPALALRSMAHVSEEKPWGLRIGGGLGLGLGLVIFWLSLRA